MSETETIKDVITDHANRATLFADLKHLYPDADGFAKEMDKYGDSMLQLLQPYPKLVQWAFFDAMRRGLEIELMESKRAHRRL